MVLHEPGPLLVDLKNVFTKTLWITIFLTALLMILALMAIRKKVGLKANFAEIGTAVVGLLCYQGKMVEYFIFFSILLKKLIFE
jgi:hypothetical protein